MIIDYYKKILRLMKLKKEEQKYQRMLLWENEFLAWTLRDDVNLLIMWKNWCESTNIDDSIYTLTPIQSSYLKTS